jgi:NAD(P)-dependent dehydrogenase (short-subunit alcohol dehydrogenase family)
MSYMAIITDGSCGIGAATAHLATEAGDDVCINYALDAEAARKVAVKCESKVRRARAAQADKADNTEVARLFHAYGERQGSLANNASTIGQATTITNPTDDTLTLIFMVHAYGSVYPQEAIKLMVKSAGGSDAVIVNISSLAAQRGSPGGCVHYATSKAEIVTFTIGRTKEVGSDGISVNALQGGTTDTDIHATVGNPDRPAAMAANAPLHRVATPEDIANGIIWLASAPADYVNGAVLPVSDGL